MMSPKDLVARGDKLFQRGQLLTLWQDVADHFYPERADFTQTHTVGDHFVEHLMTGYPVMVRRDLGNAFSAMLRPTNKQWFHVETSAPRGPTTTGRQWLEWAARVQRRAMYDRSSQFVRATKEGDHDFASFGQAVIGLRLNKNRNGLLYRNWHLRDCAWAENSESVVDTLHRKWTPEARQLADLFPATIHPKVRESLEREPYREVKCRHVVMPRDEYTDERSEFRGREYVSVYLDVENLHVMEEVGVDHFEYVVPRWQTVSGSQYAYSPATIVGLADARLIQAMTRVLLEAGEKAVDPPMVATEEVVRSDIALYAGGVTWVDSEYDERLGSALRPISQDRTGIPMGLDMAHSVKAMIAEAFYINKLTLPRNDGTKTAYEVAQLVEEYIRSALPLFEPMEHEYNGALCESTFELLLANGAFGPPSDIPRELRGAEVEFRFESPLHDSLERVKGQQFLQMKQFLREALEVDPEATSELDVSQAFRDAVAGSGAPATWLRQEDEAAELREQAAGQRAGQAMAEQAAMAASVGKDAAAAGASRAEGAEQLPDIMVGAA